MKTILGMKNSAREATRVYHRKLYASKILFQKGSSWLDKPEAEVLSVVRNNFFGKKGVKVLDLGSGVGRNAIPIAQMIGKLGGKVICVDFLNIAISKLYEYAKQYNTSQFIKGIVSPIEDFVIKPNMYDFIIAHSVLTHMENKEKMIQVMKDMAKGVKKNGFVYIYQITNHKEFDKETGKEHRLEGDVEISFAEASSLITTIYKGWTIKTLTKNPYEEIFNRRGKEILWKVDFLLFIAKNTEN